MAKYSLEFKLKLINEYKEGKGSINTIAKKYNIVHSILLTWIKLYDGNGINALKRSRKNQKYSTEFKLKVINKYFTSTLSYHDLAVEFNINNPSLITRWKLDFEKDGIMALQPKKKGRPSSMSNQKNKKNLKVKDLRTKQEKLDDKVRIKELEMKLEYAEAENAVLKKFHALGIPIPESMRDKK